MTRPPNYWNTKTITEEIKKIIDIYGYLPSEKWMRENNKKDLASAIYRDGGMRKYRDIFGLSQMKLPDGYWTDDIILRELTKIIDNLGYVPIERDFIRLNEIRLLGAIKKNGNIRKYANILGYETIKKYGYWNENTIIAELTKIIEKNGDFPSENYLRSNGKNDLVNAISRSGGIQKYRDMFGYKPLMKNNYWSEQTIKKELSEIIKKTGHFPLSSELKNTKRTDLLSQAVHRGGLNYFRKLMGYVPFQEANGYWTEEKIKEQLSDFISLYGYFPTRTDLTNLGKSKLAHAIHAHGGQTKYANIFSNITNFKSTLSEFQSYVVYRGKKTENMIYDILCNYCKKKNLKTPHTNTKLSKSNVIEFMCEDNKIIGIDVTNTKCETVVTRKWTKKDYCKYLDELWVVVVSDTFKQHHYEKWNRESPENVYVMSIDDFIKDINYNLSECEKNKIDMLKKCTFHIRYKKIKKIN